MAVRNNNNPLLGDFSILPQEVLDNILNRLDPFTIIKVGQTCREFLGLVEKNFDASGRRQFMAEKIYTHITNNAHETDVKQILSILEDNPVPQSFASGTDIPEDIVNEINERIKPEIIDAYTKNLTLRELMMINRTYNPDLFPKMNQLFSSLKTLREKAEERILNQIGLLPDRSNETNNDDPHFAQKQELATQIYTCHIAENNETQVKSMLDKFQNFTLPDEQKSHLAKGLVEQINEDIQPKMIETFVNIFTLSELEFINEMSQSGLNKKWVNMLKLTREIDAKVTGALFSPEG